MSDQKMKLYAGGTLSPRDHYYVERKEDRRLYKLCKEGEYCYILAARQLGKSSLAANAILNLEKDDIRSIYVDLQGIGRQMVERDKTIEQILDAGGSEGPGNATEARKSLLISSYQDKWYLSLLNAVLHECRDIRTKVNLESWWTSKSGFDNIQKVTIFFSEIILAQINQQVVVFFDEIDRFPERVLLDDFFMALRKMHNDRFNDPEFKRLSFVIIGHRLPRTLTQNKSISPFNIGTRLDLDDFQIEDANILASNIKLGDELSVRQVMETVFSYTGGHPYMTHEACKYLTDITNDEDEDRFYLNTEEQIAEKMEYLIRKTFAEKHLSKIHDWLNSLPNEIEVIRLYGYILEGNDVLFDETIQPLDDLRYSGLIKIVNGLAKIRNRIYAEVFSKEWVIYQLKNQHGAIAPTDFSFGLDRLGIGETGVGVGTSAKAKPEKQKPSIVTNVEEIAETFVTTQALKEPDTTNDNYKKEVTSSDIEDKEWTGQTDKPKSLTQKLRSIFGAIQDKRVAFSITGILITVLVIFWGLYVHSPASLIISGGFLIILLVAGIFVTIRSERSLVEERLGKYLDDEQTEETQEEASKPIVTEWLNRRVASSSFGDRISRELARADVKLKVGEYLAIVIVLVISLALILGSLGNWNIIPILIGAIIGFSTPRTYIKIQQGKRLKKFDGQLAGTLNLMVNGLRAGYSTMQAFEAVSRDMPPPISDEFRRVVQEMQIGIPMEVALDNLIRRIPSEDIDFIATAINVQREVGGNLSEILDEVYLRLMDRRRVASNERRIVFSSFDFFYLSSIFVVIIQNILFPDAIVLISKYRSLQTMTSAVMIVWSLILVGMAVIRHRKSESSVEYHYQGQQNYMLLVDLAVLVFAFLMGAPGLLVIWLLIILFARSPIGLIVTSPIWILFSFLFLQLAGTSFFSFDTERTQMVLEELRGLSQFFSTVLPGLTTPIFQPTSFSVSSLLPCVAVAILVVVTILTLVGLRKSSPNEDPLQARLAEFIQRGDVSSLEEIELSQPFSERVIIPFIRHLGEISARFTPQKQIQDTARKLELAGNPWPIDAPTFIALRFLLFIVGGATPFVLKLLLPPFMTRYIIYFSIFGALIAYWFPILLLNRHIKDRQDEIRRSLPDVMILLTLCTEAGLGFEAALSKVSEKWENQLSLLFARTIREIQLGKPRREALKDMSDRVGLPEFTLFVAAIIQSEQLGVSMARTLKIQSNELFNNRRESVLQELSRYDLISKTLFFILFGPIFIYWFLWPVLVQLSMFP